MRHQDDLDETICRILRSFRRIAVVGFSDKPWRDSHRVARYLMTQGYEVVPVNPEIDSVAGLPSYPDLRSVSGPIEVVNVFRRLEFIPEVVDQTINVRASALWTQYGLGDPVSAERARKAGLQVVMDRCIMVEHMKHFG
jgi:predicted CoA-binding protein